MEGGNGGRRGASGLSAGSEKAGYRRAAGGDGERERADGRADARPGDVSCQYPRYLKAADAAHDAAGDGEGKPQRPGGNPPPSGSATPKRDRRETQSHNEPDRRADNGG